MSKPIDVIFEDNIAMVEANNGLPNSLENPLGNDLGKIETRGQNDISSPSLNDPLKEGANLALLMGVVNEVFSGPVLDELAMHVGRPTVPGDVTEKKHSQLLLQLVRSLETVEVPLNLRGRNLRRPR